MTSKHNKTIAKIIFPFIALMMMLLGSQLTFILSAVSKQTNIIDCQLLVLTIITSYFYFGYTPYLFVISTLLGIIYDVYYYELLGIYTICLPLMIILLHMLLKYFKPSILNYLLVFVFCNIWIIYSTYFIQVIFGVTKLEFISYIVLYVAPTLVVNTIINLVALFYGEKYYLNVTKNITQRTGFIF